jgi:hypothetical protein
MNTVTLSTHVRWQRNRKAGTHHEAHEAVIGDQFMSPPNVIRQKRRGEKPKKSKVGFHPIFIACSKR